MFENNFLDKLQSLQEMVTYNNSYEIRINGRDKPIHKDINRNLFEGEFEFRNLPIYCFDDKSYFERVKISNKGRIEIDGKIVEQNLDSKERLIVNIPGKKYNPQKVWELVGLTWRDGRNTMDCYDGMLGRKIIHHLDNNGYNNDYENLLWVTSSEHEMIHIKGIWLQGNYQLIFIGDKFFLTNNNEEILKGKFLLNIQNIIENDKFIKKGNIIFKTIKETLFCYERKYFSNIIITAEKNSIKELIGKWEFKNI
jgi:hypothetical protein